MKLSITHIVGGPIAPCESAVILSVTPNHGGVTDARQDQQQRSRLAGGRAFCGGPSRQASGPSAAPVAGSDVSCAGKPIPAACGDWAAAKAAYRFFDNPHVTEHSVLAGHFAATAARVGASEGPILVLHDRIDLQPRAGGQNRLHRGYQRRALQGRAAQRADLVRADASSLAVTLTGTPLGLTAAKFWTRTKFKGNARAQAAHQSHARADRDEGELPLAGEPAPVHRGPERCVHVGDRESDICELYCTAQDLGTSFLEQV